MADRTLWNDKGRGHTGSISGTSPIGRGRVAHPFSHEVTFLGLTIKLGSYPAIRARPHRSSLTAEDGSTLDGDVGEGPAPSGSYSLTASRACESPSNPSEALASAHDCRIGVPGNEPMTPGRTARKKASHGTPTPEGFAPSHRWAQSWPSKRPGRNTWWAERTQVR